MVLNHNNCIVFLINNKRWQLAFLLFIIHFHQHLSFPQVELHTTREVMWLGGVVTVAVVHQATGRLLRRYRHPASAHGRSLQAFIGALQPDRLLLLVGQVIIIMIIAIVRTIMVMVTMMICYYDYYFY